MILSHIQIEEIAAAVTKDFNEFFFGGRAAFETHYAQATPIDQLAGDYLGLRVSFARLSDDGSICGLTAYTDTEYAATCQGRHPAHPAESQRGAAGQQLHGARTGQGAVRQAAVHPCP